MAEKRGQYEYRDDGTIAQLTTAEVTIEDSLGIIPTEIQSRYAVTIQTHNAVSVGASGGANTSLSSWFDADGFDQLCIHFKNDAGTSSWGDVQWSVDGVTQMGADFSVIANNTFIIKSGNVPVKSRYFRVVIANGDAALAHTMSVWAYLKA